MPRAAPWPVLHDTADAELGMLGHWSLGLDPIANLVDLLEERGIKVLAMSLPNVDGLTARVRRDDRGVASVVVVNRDDFGERQRFTLAYELGHMALDPATKIDEEKAAQRFAGAFLMPAETLRSEIDRNSIDWGELFELKRVVCVSVQALTYRRKDLGIFGAPVVRQLFKEFTRRGWRSPPSQEPGAMPSERPLRFERLCFRALAEGAITEAKAAELLGHSVHELNCRMDEPPSLETVLAGTWVS